MFTHTSRYHPLEIAEFTAPDGRVIRHVRRRFIPRVHELMGEYAGVAGDRYDSLAARFYGDTEQFWRLCDANIIEDPDHLTAQVGRVLGIPSPLSRQR